MDYIRYREYIAAFENNQQSNFLKKLVLKRSGALGRALTGFIGASGGFEVMGHGLTDGTFIAIFKATK
jgi:hypothetical protein